MPLALNFYEDVLFAGEVAELAHAAPRAIYLAAGQARVGGRELANNDGCVSIDALRISAGSGGACLWRWEVTDNGAPPQLASEHSFLKLAPQIFTNDVSATHLIRLDSVAFPPGGCALLHTHQGPGIRCLIEGTIRIDCDGHSHAHGPGSPWFEAGPEPVFAQADMAVATRFIRAMVLPKDLMGKSSIRYVNAEDRDKPKSQTYHVFDEIALGA